MTPGVQSCVVGGGYPGIAQHHLLVSPDMRLLVTALDDGRPVPGLIDGGVLTMGGVAGTQQQSTLLTTHVTAVSE